MAVAAPAAGVATAVRLPQLPLTVEAVPVVRLPQLPLAVDAVPVV